MSTVAKWLNKLKCTVCSDYVLGHNRKYDRYDIVQNCDVLIKCRKERNGKLSDLQWCKNHALLCGKMVQLDQVSMSAADASYNSEGCCLRGCVVDECCKLIDNLRLWRVPINSRICPRHTHCWLRTVQRATIN